MRRIHHLGLFVCGALLASVTCSAQPQKTPRESTNPPEMQIIDGGFLAINTPNGWQRAEGPGLTFFLKRGVRREKANVWIYVSGIPTDAGEADKNLDECVQSDIVHFKERFKQGTVRQEQPLVLPKAKAPVPIVTFESNEAHNSFEQVVYIEETGRVLTLVLSAKNAKAFAKSLPVFQEFARSYGGSIFVTSEETKP
jgi:hypothetical protein